MVQVIWSKVYTDPPHLLSADSTQAVDVSEECVVWVDIILLYLLTT